MITTKGNRARDHELHDGRGGAEQTLRGLGFAGYLADEALTTGADNERPTEDRQLGQATHQLEVVLHRFAESDARVQQDSFDVDAVNAGRNDALV